MLSIPAASAGLIDQQSKRLAFCWQITRQDTTILRFTSHDRILTVGGNAYTPIGGIDGTATRRETALKEQNVEVRGIITSDKITNADLRAGRYRDAQIDEQLVDWRYPFAPAIAQTRYWISKVDFDGKMWHAQCEGPSRWLKHNVGTVFGRQCRWNLYDTDCQVSLAGFQAIGVVVLGTTDGEKRRIIRADPASLSGGFADAFFANGNAIFTTGANSGLKGEIKLYTMATRLIELQLGMPYDIAIGDTLTVQAGCDKLATTCNTKFSNIIRFGGFPFMPTTDRVLGTTPRSH